jgi:hypothetical protein
VKAYNASGDSPYSAVDDATTLPKPPSAPAGLKASAVSSSQINLTWQACSGDVSGYKIERSSSGSSGGFSLINTVGSNVTAYSDTGLNSTTTYYYRVRAYNAGGDSAYSSVAQAATLAPPPQPPALKPLSNTSKNGGLTPSLQWSASSGASSYTLQVASDSAFTHLLLNQSGLTTLSYDIASGVLKKNTNYYWRVSAQNSTGTSSWSSASFQTP